MDNYEVNDTKAIIYGIIIIIIVLIISVAILMLLNIVSNFMRGSEYIINISSISFIDDYDDLVENKYSIDNDDKSNDSALYIIDINGNVMNVD